MLSISQFSKLLRIPTKTLRYYDSIDLFKPAEVNQENGYRYYTTEQLATMLFIQKLKKYEFSLEEIKLVLADNTILLPLFTAKKAELENKLAAYTLLKSDLEKDLNSLTKGGINLLNQENYAISITENQKMNLFSIRKTINLFKDFDSLVGEVFSQVQSQQLTPAGAPLTFYHSPEHTPEQYDVEFAVPVLETTKVTKSFQTGKCATITHVGKYEELTGVYSALTQWLAENNFDLANSPFEIYLSDPATTPPDKNQIAAYFPIKAKN